jgi:hypothetical protein
MRDNNNKSWLIDEFIKFQMLKQNELKKQKGYNMTNNSKALHEAGEKKRIDNYNTMQTINAMSYNPSRIALKAKQKFYGNVLKMLKLA